MRIYNGSNVIRVGSSGSLTVNMHIKRIDILTVKYGISLSSCDFQMCFALIHFYTLWILRIIPELGFHSISVKDSVITT